MSKNSINFVAPAFAAASAAISLDICLFAIKSKKKWNENRNQQTHSLTANIGINAKKQSLT